LIQRQWSYSWFQWTMFGCSIVSAFLLFLMTIRLFSFTSSDKTNFLQNPVTGETVNMKNVSPETRSPKVVDNYIRKWVKSTYTWTGKTPSGAIDTGDRGFGVLVPSPFAVGMMSLKAPYRFDRMASFVASYKNPAVGAPLDKFVSGRLKASVGNSISITNLFEDRPGHWRCDLAFAQIIKGGGKDFPIIYSGKFELDAIPPASNVWSKKGSPYEDGAKELQAYGLTITFVE
jgi:hypothetical protein